MEFSLLEGRVLSVCPQGYQGQRVGSVVPKVLAGRWRVQGEAVPSGGFGDHAGEGAAGQQAPPALKGGSQGKVRRSDLVPLPLHFFIPQTSFPVSQVQSSHL